ncbi:MAG: four-helix bundle copper-binding protein [Phycisphaerae bacterium]
MGVDNVKNYASCIQACQACATDCENCLHQMLNKESDNDCPACCRTCLDICILCAQESARNGRFIAEICQLCEKICTWCAEQCEAHDHDHCRECAKSCRACAEECRKVAA